jgi:hypothetical protein
MAQCEVGLKQFRGLNPDETPRCTADAETMLIDHRTWHTAQPDTRILLCSNHARYNPGEKT